MKRMDFRLPKDLVRGSTLGAAVLLGLAALLMVNYLGWKYHHRFDWTASRLYTLSQKSRNVAEGLKKDVEFVVFLSPVSEIYEPLMELLSRYEAVSPRISIRTLDPERRPIEAERLLERYAVTTASVVVAAGDDRRVIEESDLAELDFSGVQFGQGPTIAAFKGEQRITGALLDLQDARKPKVLFTTGHGELRLDDTGPSGLSSAQQFLGDDNFVVEEWASLGAASVPEGADLLVIAAPTATFLEPELDLFGRHLAAGGRMLVLLDPTLEGGGLVTTGLEGWLEDQGVEVGADIVVDPSNPMPFFGAESIFVTSFGRHPTTGPLSNGDLPVMVSLARSVRRDSSRTDLAAAELLFTSAQGWGERDLDRLDTALELGDEDLVGPVSLGVAVELVEDPLAEEGSEGKPEDAQSEVEREEVDSEAPADSPGSRDGMRLLVIGDSDFASNRLLQANLGNRVLLTNALNWLVEREALLAIPAKEPERVRLNMSQGQLRWAWLLVLLILPGSGILMGVLVYLRRRR